MRKGALSLCVWLLLVSGARAGAVFISGDDAQLVDTTSSPRLSSHFFSSLRWVVLPEPSGPSNAIRRPREASRSAIKFLMRRAFCERAIRSLRYHRVRGG